MATNLEITPQLIVYACTNSAAMGFSEGELMFDGAFYRAKLIKLPCSGNVDILYLLRALEVADGVVIIACRQENCKYIKGNSRAKQRVLQARKMLEEIGLEEERVQMYGFAANEQAAFEEAINRYATVVKEMGPNPGKVKT